MSFLRAIINWFKRMFGFEVEADKLPFDPTNYDGMTKKDLVATAKLQYGVTLKASKRRDALMAELEALHNGE